MKKKINWKVLVVSLVLVVLVSLFGGLSTGESIRDGWYDSIKPSIAPPNWVFGPVWTILYILIGISLYFAWTNAKTSKQRWQIGIAFGVNLVANALWSFLFFGQQEILLAFYDILLIWVTIIFMMAFSFKSDKKAGWMLVPYFLWVSFAMVLNYLSYLRSLLI